MARDLFGNQKGSKWYNVGLYDAWSASKRGKSSPGWSQIYPWTQMIPIVNTAAKGFNNILEANKLEANTGVRTEDYTNPASNPESVGLGEMGQAMRGMARSLDDVYGNPRPVDRAARRYYSSRGYRSGYYAGRNSYRNYGRNRLR